jgi:hypothetical protein
VCDGSILKRSVKKKNQMPKKKPDKKRESTQFRTSITPSWAKGIKPEILTMIDLARGVIAGMLADKYLGNQENTYEAALRPHCIAVAHKRGFSISLEFKLPREVQVNIGAHKKLDYLLTYGHQVIAIECKTICGEKRPLNIANIDIDLKKLRTVASLASKSIRSSAWLMIAEIRRKSKIGDSEVQIINHPPIKKLLKKLDIMPIDVISDDDDFLSKNKRKFIEGTTFISEGKVGSYHAWCIVSCVTAPSGKI